MCLVYSDNSLIKLQQSEDIDCLLQLTLNVSNIRLTLLLKKHKFVTLLAFQRRNVCELRNTFTQIKTHRPKNVTLT